MERLWAWDWRISQRAVQALAELQPGHVDTVSDQLVINIVSSEQCEHLQGSDGEREGEAGQGEDGPAAAGEETRPGPGTKCRDAGPVQRFGETQCWNIMRYKTRKCTFPSHNIRFKGILKFVSAAANSKVFDVQNVPRQ